MNKKTVGITKYKSKDQSYSVELAHSTKPVIFCNSTPNTVETDMDPYWQTLMASTPRTTRINLESRANIVTSAMIMYDQYGVVRSFCDCLTNFVATSYRFTIDESKDKSGRIRKFWEKYYKNLKMTSVIRNIAQDIIRAGNSMVVASRGNYVPATERFEQISGDGEYVFDTYTGKIISSKSYECALWENKMDLYGEVSIPTRFDLLSPDTVSVRQVGLNEWIYDVSIVEAQYKSLIDGSSKVKMPPALRKIFDKQNMRTMTLTSKDLNHIAYKKNSYEDYGIPFWWGAAPTIEQIASQLINDDVIARGQMNNAWLVKLGSDKFPAGQTQIDAAIELFGRGVNQGATYFWNHAIDVSPLRSEIVPTSKEKYDVMNTQMLNELGFPLVFAGGMTGSNYSVAGYEIIPLMQMVTDLQTVIQDEFLTPFHEEVSDAMGFRVIPEGRFSRNMLRDQNKLLQNVITLWDHGVYMLDQVADVFGTTEEAIIQQTKNIDELVKSGDFPIVAGNGSPYNSPKDGAGKVSGPPQSRPANQPNPKYKDGRDPRKMTPKA